MDRSFGKKIVSSEATEEEIHHARTGTLDQVEAIALLRAFDPGERVRIAFDGKSVASILRGEPFVRSVLQMGQTSQLMLARTFSDLNNCLISTTMEHISDFLRDKFAIDVPPVFLCDILDGDLRPFRSSELCYFCGYAPLSRLRSLRLMVPAAFAKSGVRIS